jgi:hypothetical protein
LVHLGKGEKISAIDKAQPIHVPHVLPGIGMKEREKRMVLVTTRPTTTLNREAPRLRKWATSHVTLARPCAVKVEEIVTTMGHLHRHTQRATKMKICIPTIVKRHRSRDNRARFVRRVGKGYLEPRNPIDKEQLKG